MTGRKVTMTLEQLQDIIAAMRDGNTAMANLRNYVNTLHSGSMPLHIAEQVSDFVSYAEILSTILNTMAKETRLSNAIAIVEASGYEVKAPQR